MTTSTTARTPGNAVLRKRASRDDGRVPAWLWPAVLTAMLAVGGCGSSEEPAEPAAPPETAAKPSEQKPEKPAPEAQETPPPEEAASALPEEPPEPKVPRPDKVADWAPADYVSAKEDRDPRLVDAVAFLAEQGAGDEAAAGLLARLLVTPETPVPDPSPQPKAEPAKEKPSAREYGDDDDDYGEEEEEYDDDDDDNDDYGDDDDDNDDDDEDEYTGDYANHPPRVASQANVAPQADVALLKPGYVSLVGAIVRSLGANGTEASRRVLEHLLTGTIDTGSDRVAVSAALQSLIDYRCPENEALLFRALTDSDTMRPEGQGDVTAEQLRETAFQLVTETASPQMRMDLARYLFSPNPSAALRDRLVRFVMKSHPYNVTPQAAIYPRPQTSETVKREFEVYFTTYSSSTLGRLLGVSAPAAPEQPLADLEAAPPGAAGANQPWVAFGAAATAPAPQPLPPQARPAMEAEEEDYGDDDDDNDDDEGYEEESEEEEEEGGYSPGRAAAAPSDLSDWASGSGRRVDAASVEAFRQVAQIDPELGTRIASELWSPTFAGAVVGRLGAISSLQSDAQLVNLASTIPTDAVRKGLYATLQAHWEEGPQGLLTAAALPEEGTIDPGFMAVVKTIPREMPAKDRPPTDSPKYDWLKSSYSLLRYLCDCFQKAAGTEAAAVDPKELLEDLPVKLPDDARVVAAYRFDWQQQAAGRLADAPVDPLVIHYVRMQENTRYSRMLGYYRRAVSSPAVRELTIGAWLDSYHTGSAPDRKRSVDVLITRLPENTDTRSTEDEPLDVEILSIEVKDPSQP